MRTHFFHPVHFGHLSYCMYYCWDWHHYKEVGLGIKIQSYKQIGCKQTSNFVSYLEDGGINLLPKLCVVKIHHRLSLCEENSCVFPFMYIYIFFKYDPIVAVMIMLSDSRCTITQFPWKSWELVHDVSRSRIAWNKLTAQLFATEDTRSKTFSGSQNLSA